MYIQLKLLIWLYACTTKITHIYVCIHNYDYSYKCMLTKYKWHRNQIKNL